MTKTDEKMLSHLLPISAKCDTYLCCIAKNNKDEFMYTVFDNVKAWVEKNGGTMRKLDGGKLFIGEKKGFEVQIRFPCYTERDMKNIMATLF